MTVRKRGTVGVVGLGIMGGAFAQHLVAAGWRVIGYDIAAARRRALKRAGVEIAANAAELARAAPTIIVSLPSPAALAATVDAIVKAGVPRRVVIEASTFALADKEAAEAALRAAGHVLLDCPVSGTGAQAKVKDIVVYASGGAAEIKRLTPLFAAFSRAVHDLGTFGNGSRIKYVANLLVAIHNVASAEAMVLGIKAGLPPQLIYELVKGRRRHFARVRATRADDGEGPLRRSDDDDRGLAEGHGCHRRFCANARRADAIVLGNAADLCRRDVDRPRRRRYRRRLRRARSDGRHQARQGEGAAREKAIEIGWAAGSHGIVLISPARSRTISL